MSRCRIKNFCIQTTSGFRKISESNDLILQGSCATGCSSANSFQYFYRLYKNTGDEVNFFWTELTSAEYDLVLGFIELYKNFI